MNIKIFIIFSSLIFSSLAISQKIKPPEIQLSINGNKANLKTKVSLGQTVEVTVKGEVASKLFCPSLAS